MCMSYAKNSFVSIRALKTAITTHKINKIRNTYLIQHANFSLIINCIAGIDEISRKWSIFSFTEFMISETVDFRKTLTNCKIFRHMKSYYCPKIINQWWYHVSEYLTKSASVPDHPAGIEIMLRNFELDWHFSCLEFLIWYENYRCTWNVQFLYH